MRFLTKLSLLLALLAGLASSPAAASAPPHDFRLSPEPAIRSTTAIHQYGITWTFAEPVQYGQFANGDYYVVDPGKGVKIISISPGHTLHPETGRHMNGSMLNPVGPLQGFDGAREYDIKLNVGIGVSLNSPLVLTANNSLVTAISNPTQGGPSHISYTKTAAILTCLPNHPLRGSFRPGYSDPEKTIYGTIGDLDYSMLGKLVPPSSTPGIETYAKLFQKTWLFHSGSWTSRFMHPSDNIPDNYYYTAPASIAALLLHLDYADWQKERLLVNFIQHGIDLYGAIKGGTRSWDPHAGIGFSRKWPILFAGIMLDAAGMKEIGEVSGNYLYSVEGYGPGKPPPGYIGMAEDALLFYVTQEDVNRTNSPQWRPDSRIADVRPYSQDMIGMPEWGHRHSGDPYQSYSGPWTAGYRLIGSGIRNIIGATLSAHIMDAKTLWNHNAHFDYVDRYMAITKGDPDPFGYKVEGENAGGRAGGFLGEMWDKYRANY